MKLRCVEATAPECVILHHSVPCDYSLKHFSSNPSIHHFQRGGEKKKKKWKWAEHHSLYVGYCHQGAEEEEEEEEDAWKQRRNGFSISLGHNCKSETLLQHRHTKYISYSGAGFWTCEHTVQLRVGKWKLHEMYRDKCLETFDYHSFRTPAWKTS